ncbi:MAG: urease accessory protein UreF [Desulfarculus sp.]|nr:urease accessory protein UreF [Desulfarculus sp.]
MGPRGRQSRDSEPTGDLGACLQLLRLCSPALPIGAYSYSQGLEWAVEAGWVSGEEDAGQWLMGLLRFSWTYLEVPVMVRLHQAWRDGSQPGVRRWNAFLLASRESAEMQAAELNMGQALARLLAELGLAEAKTWSGRGQASLAAMFALAAVQGGIGRDQACAGYLWSLAEGLVSAALKLVPLGQTAGQRLLFRACQAIPQALSVGLSLEDGEIGYMAPGLAMASALHETQRTRLFRS